MTNVLVVTPINTITIDSTNTGHQTAVVQVKQVLEQKGCFVAHRIGANEAKAFLQSHEVFFVVTVDEIKPDEHGDSFVLYCRKEAQPVPIVYTVWTSYELAQRRNYNTESLSRLTAMGYLADIETWMPRFKPKELAAIVDRLDIL